MASSTLPAQTPWSVPALVGLGLSIAAIPVNVLLNLAIGAAGSLGSVVGIVQLIVVPMMLIGGTIFSIVGIVQTQGGKRKGRGRAIAGVIVGPILLVLWVAFSVLYVVLDSGTAAQF